MNSEHIVDVFKHTLTKAPEVLHAEKNIRLSGKHDVWDVTASYAQQPGLRELYVQLKYTDMNIQGMSCVVEVSSGHTVRIDLSFDGSGPVIDLYTSKTLVSVFYNRIEDNVRFSINTEIPQMSIADLISHKRNVLVQTISQAVQCDMAKPGALDAESATESDTHIVRDMAVQALESVGSTLDEVALCREKLTQH